MPEDRRRDDPRPGDPAEGVRIIDAEEAAEAIERGDVAARRGSHLPRYGDRPARPPAGSPKPALRFPLDAGTDPADSANLRPAKGVRFDPRPPPSWDDAPAEPGASGAEPDAPVDAEAPTDSWGEDSWRGGDDWGEPQEDVAAWTRGETGTVPAVEGSDAAVTPPAEETSAGSWADEFAEDEDPWDGSWDEPTGTVRWADDLDAADAAEGDATVDAEDAGAVPEAPVEAWEDDLAEEPEAAEESQEDAAWAAFTDAADAGDALAAGAVPASEDDLEPISSEVQLVDDDDTVSGQRPPLFDPDGGWAEDPGPVFDFGDEPSGQVSLPHWTEPATGELPRVLVDDTDGEPSGSTPAMHWRDHDAGWAEDDLDHLTGMDEARVGALDPERPHDDDIYSFDDDEEDLEVETVGVPERRVPPPRPTAAAPSGAGAGRNVGLAAAVGVGFAAAALVIFAVGSWATMLLIIAILALGVIEYQNAVRRAGYRPAALVGIVAAVCIPLAVHWRGLEAYPLVGAVTLGALLAWYLVGADPQARVVESAGVTLLGIAWVVGLGSFAALLLAQPDGLGLLIGAIIATVGYDVGGFAIGRSMGARPLSAASPNKTVEGLLGGMLCSLIALTVVGLFGLAPYDAGFALKVGVLAALAAPLGDLCESLVKRDLGIKDMGSLLPEHGGILDRFDALLFVLPAVYFGAVLFL